MNIIPNIVKAKLHLCASGSILLPLAQKWGLVGVVAVAALSAFGAQTVSAASITLSTPTTLSVDVTPSAEGTFAKSIKPGSITVSSNAYAGYTLKIQDNDGESALTGKSGKLPSIPNEITENDFNSNTRYNNMWGYKPSVFSGSKNENFLPSPKQAGDVIDKTDPSSNDSVTKDYTVELGVRVDNNQPAGTYTGTFIFTATANDLKYSITYDDNGADGNKPANKSASAPEGTQIPLASAPTRTGYVFMGWCDKATENETCAGHKYNASEQYTVANNANSLSLYAMWLAIPTTIMQNFTPAYCDYMKEHETITLEDTRDHEEYKVRKLKDGRCWMVDNIRIAGELLTPDDTDLEENIVSFNLPASSAVGFNNDSYANVYVMSDSGYYTWCAATAGTCTSTRGTNASSSVCPKGWRLPTVSAKDEYTQLAKAYGYGTDAASVVISNFRDENGPNFIFTGFYNGSSIGNQEKCAHFWSSTACASNNAYGFDLCSTSLTPAEGSGSSSQGLSVRCVARE